MLIFVILIILSFVVYFYNKTKQFRTRTVLPIRKKWYAARASMALGSFVTFFGINQLFVFQSILTYIISSVFIILGLALVYYNFKASKHYHAFLEEEADLNP
ncbi:MAG: YtpI family protein [Planococcus sp. (in: firmicutes)]|uniref:YtpI family protein n=1 Tax=Planococcus halocryophilus TaxID=1215089 RepID=UPI001F0D6360|nr:YtpI family protein [Planococcus halocryophilus]MCH4827005.1 YtpI family protein [Planococcus halocryophilus]